MRLVRRPVKRMAARTLLLLLVREARVPRSPRLVAGLCKAELILPRSLRLSTGRCKVASVLRRLQPDACRCARRAPLSLRLVAGLCMLVCRDRFLRRKQRLLLPACAV